MEHAVYLCTWSSSPNGCVLWVKARPNVRGEGRTFDEAEEELLDAIRASGGAMQAVLEFEPAPPKSTLDEKYTTPELYVIGGDDRFETDAPRRLPFESAEDTAERFRWSDAFYQSPLCRQCGNVSSARSEKPLTLTFAPPRADGAFGYVSSDAGPTHQIYSQEFLAALTEGEKRGLIFRPTIRKGRRKFYELIGPEGPPHVAVDGLHCTGWRCTECDYHTWGYFIYGLSVNRFVARSDLPEPLPGVFTVGRSPEIELAVTAERWKELVGHKGTRGFVSRPLGVVPDREVIRRPELPTQEERT